MNSQVRILSLSHVRSGSEEQNQRILISHQDAIEISWPQDLGVQSRQRRITYEGTFEFPSMSRDPNDYQQTCS